jgi:hypothetical protein
VGHLSAPGGCGFGAEHVGTLRVDDRLSGGSDLSRASAQSAAAVCTLMVASPLSPRPLQQEGGQQRTS